MKTSLKNCLFGILLSIFAIPPRPANATVYLWTNTGPVSGTWSDTANWSGGIAPLATTGTDVVRFFGSASVLLTGNITASNNIASLLAANQFIFSGKGASAAYTVTLNGSSLQLTGTDPALVLEATAGAATITYNVYNNIQITAPARIASSGWGIFNLRGVLSGTGSLTIDATRPQLTLYAANTYQGATTLTGGKLYLGTNNTLPASTDLTIAAGATVNLNSPYAGTSGGNQTLRSLSGSGTLTNGNDSTTRTLTLTGGGTSLFAGALTAGYSSTAPDRSRLALTISGTSRLTLTGTGHNYTGATTVNIGDLVVNGALAATPISVNNGGLLCGTGTLAGSVTLNAGATIAGGDETTIGVLTTGPQTWNDDSAFLWTINDGAGTAGASWDQLVINGTLFIDALNTSPVVLALNTYTTAGSAGPMANFNTLVSGTWTVATASDGITNFSADTVALDISGVQNALFLEGLPLGRFSVTSGTDNKLNLVYTRKTLPPMGAFGGAYGGSNPYGSGIMAFERWMGQPVAMAVSFIDPTASTWTYWEGCATNFVSRECAEKDRHVFCYTAGMTLTGTTTSLAEGATGAYNSHWTYLAKKLVAGGCGDAIIRPGHEMNGAWYPWKVNSATAATNFKNYWIQIVNTMRAVSPNFKFCFCVSNGNPSGYNQYLAAAYPGDDYVDYIGVDVYDCYSNSLTPGDRWSFYTSSQYAWGLDTWVNYFSTTKPLAIPEWGLWITGDNGGNGDNDYFISQMYKWITNPAKRVAFHMYFDNVNVNKISNNQFPSSATMFRDTFGQLQYWDQEIGDVPTPGVMISGTSSLTVKGSGTGIGGTSDNFHFTYTPVSGNTSMTARITSVSSTDPDATAGVMMRENLNTASTPSTTINTSGTGRCVFAGVKNGNLVFQYRNTPGAAAVTTYTGAASLPLWVRITRSGSNYNTFTGYTSADGVAWTSIGAQTIVSDTNAYMGFAVASGNSAEMNIASFDNVNNLPSIVMDNSDSSGVVISGTWTSRTDEYYKNGSNCLGNVTADANTYVRFTPAITEPGLYNVYLCYSGTNARAHASNVPVNIASVSGTSTVTVNQNWDYNGYPYSCWHPLGTFEFTSGSSGYVQINTAGTTAEVVADAVRFKKILKAPQN